MGKKKRQSMKEKAQQNAKNSKKGSSFLNLPDGVERLEVKPKKKYTIDILPYVVSAKGHMDGIDVGDIWFKRPYRLHGNIGSDRKAYICPSTIGKKCPICERRMELLKDPDTDYEDDEVKALKAKDRVLYNVRTVNGKKFGDIKIFDFSFWLFQNLLDEEINDPDNDEYGGFADLEGGYSLEVKFKEESFAGRKYPEARKINFEDRKDIKESILDEVVDLDTILEIKSYKELERILLDVDDEDTDDDTDDDTDTDDDDDNDDDDNDTDDDDDNDDDDNDDDDNDTDDDPDGDDDEVDIDSMEAKELLIYIKENKIKIDSKELKKAKKDAKKLRKLITKNMPEEKDEDSEYTCPHGHSYGVDCDDKKECDECDLWDKCYDTKG